MSVIFIILLGTTIFLLVLHTTTTRNHIHGRKKNSSGSRYQILRRYGVFFLLREYLLRLSVVYLVAIFVVTSSFAHSLFSIVFLLAMIN